MPSRRHSSEMFSSPRNPSSTMRIFSSAPYCLRVARRISFTTCSADAFCVPDFCLIFAPLKGYDEPEILPSQLSRLCLIGADAGQSKEFLEAGKRRLAGDTARAATPGEVKDLRREATALKEVVADLTLENRLLKKSMKIG